MRGMVRRLAPFLLLAVLTGVFFWKLAFTDQILARGDTFSYFYPYREIRNEALRAGRLPLWTPDLFMGAPLLADPQVATFYLPDWLTIPFSAPDGVKISILLHVFLAGAGMFVLFSATVPPPPNSREVGRGLPALVAASVFAFGGFAGAHVEQINQLEGLAWMPWLCWLLHLSLPSLTIPRSRRSLYLLLFAGALAMQFFSGHTQTLFITGAGLAIYALVAGMLPKIPPSLNSKMPRTHFTVSLPRIIFSLLLLAGGVVIALLLAVPQLLPTLELTGMSNRGGSGFNAQQATAFSLPLTYIGRALLPSYDGLLFTEYIGYIGVIALGLMLYGALTPFTQSGDGERRVSPRFLWIIIGAIGLFFAFGRYNPVYFWLADLPGFNLFRVPARWLALFALAAAMLAGMGVQALSLQAAALSENRATLRRSGIKLAMIFLPIFALMVAAFKFDIQPEDISGGTGTPTTMTLVLWAMALIALLICLLLPRFLRQSGGHAVARPYSMLISGLVVLELFAASFIQPYNDLAPRDVYEGQRFAISQMLAYQDGQIPPGRVLSISGLQFDPGNKTSLQARFDRAGMDAQAQHTAFTAVKKQEMLFPNLSLAWGIPTVDGYGGGILPTTYYTQFTSLLLPEGMGRTVDGRLGEMLALPGCRGACVPEDQFLVMMDVRYLITDKVYDLWHEGVAYDTKFSREPYFDRVRDLFSLNAPYPFEANQINILYANHEGQYRSPSFEFYDDPADREPLIQVPGELTIGELGGFELVSAPLDQPVMVSRFVVVTGLPTDEIVAVTLVDTRTGDFLQVPLRYPVSLSSDVRLYGVGANRAYLAQHYTYLPDTWEGSERGLPIVADNIVFSSIAIIHEADRNEYIKAIDTLPPGTIEFTRYEPERVTLTAQSKGATFLLLKDAWYPGWKATVNGEPAPVYRANVMFRAVKVPAGASTVEFYFQPDLWIASLIFGAVAWLLWLVAIIGYAWRKFH